MVLSLDSAKSDIPTHLPLGTRLVWILARPLEGRIIRSVSSGNFPLCHWMVFISDHDIEFERIKRILEDLRTHDLSQYDHIRLGMVHQMYRDPTSNTTVRAAEIFSTLNLIGKYATASIAYAGKTRFTDPEIDTFARGIMDVRDDYRLLENNCQHFAKALIRDITGEDLCPKTIADLLRPFIDFTEDDRLAHLRSNSLSKPSGFVHNFFGASVVASSIEGNLGMTVNPTDAVQTLPYSMDSWLFDRGVQPRWDEVRGLLRSAEAKHLLQLKLGEPVLIQDFYITDDGNSRTQAICVLFHAILLMFRYQKETAHTYFESPRSSISDGMSYPHNEPKLSVYGYLFPRHIDEIIPKPNGFELVCPGLWLGEDRASPTLTFRFEMSIHSEEIPYRWMKFLHTFKRTKYDREYTAIFDRIPLDRPYASEIDVRIGSKIYRIVTRGALDFLNFNHLYQIVCRQIEHLGHQSAYQVGRLRIQYLDKANNLHTVSPDFPDDTDFEWREFYAAVFYVDLET